MTANAVKRAPYCVYSDTGECQAKIMDKMAQNSSRGAEVAKQQGDLLKALKLSEEALEQALGIKYCRACPELLRAAERRDRERWR